MLWFCAGKAAAEEIALDFTADPTLKQVFDAGLRPYRRLNLATVQVRADKTRVGISLPEGVVIGPQDWQTLDFIVVSDGRIVNLEATSPPLSLEEARKVFAACWSKQEKLPEAVDAFLAKVKNDPLLFEDSLSLGTGNRRNPLCLLAFRRTGLRDRPLAVEVSLDWKLMPESARSSFYRIPIPPPPGYEGFSMDPPAEGGRGRAKAAETEN